MKNFKVCKDGFVFCVVTEPSAMSLVGHRAELFAIDSSGEETAIESEGDVREAVSRGDALGLATGYIAEFIEERKTLFRSLRDIETYHARHGRLPWGMRMLAKHNGWRITSEPGVSLRLDDVREGMTLRFYARENRIELC